MGIFKEFMAFAKRGNVLDVAIGVAVAAAFGKIVSSLVADIIMPPIGIILGKVSFDNLFLALDGNSYPTVEAAKEAGVAVMNFGSFAKAFVDFVIVAFVLFLIMYLYNKKLRKTEEKEETTKECPFCHSTIAIKATRCPNCTSQLTEETK